MRSSNLTRRGLLGGLLATSSVAGAQAWRPWQPGAVRPVFQFLGGGVVVGGLAATVFPIPPNVQWHAGQSTITMRAATTITGYISNGTSGTAGQILTVTQINGAATNGPSALLEGMVLTSGAAGGTVIVKSAQTGGGNGGPGNYVVSVSQAVGTSASPVTFTIAATQVASVSDLMGNANLSSQDGEAPRLMTDALGRKFLRFIAPANYVGSWMQNLALAALDTHNFAAVIVARIHSMTSMNLVSIGSKVNGTGTTHQGVGLLANGLLTTTGLRPDYQSGGNPVSSINKLFVGTQLQVLGSATATDDGIGGTAQGSASTTTLIALNEQTAALANSNVRSKGVLGIEVGKVSNVVTGTTSAQYAFIDLYEMSLWTTGQLGNRSQVTARFNAAQAAAIANFNVPAITDSLVLTGDSRSINGAAHQAANGADGSGYNLATILTEPGSPVALPATTRVLNIAVTGQGVGTAASYLDATVTGNNLLPALSAAAMLGGGHDKVHWYSGINDVTGARWPTDNYAASTTGIADEIYGTDRTATFTATIAASSNSLTAASITGKIAPGSRPSFSGANAGLSVTAGSTSPFTVNQYQVTAASGVAATATLSSYKSFVEILLNRGYKVVWAREISYGTDTAGTTELRARAANCVADVTSDLGATLAANLKTYDLSQITVGGSALFGSAYVGGNVLNDEYVDGTHQTAKGKRNIVSGGDTPANGVFANVRY